MDYYDYFLTKAKLKYNNGKLVDNGLINAYMDGVIAGISYLEPQINIIRDQNELLELQLKYLNTWK